MRGKIDFNIFFNVWENGHCSNEIKHFRTAAAFYPILKKTTEGLFSISLQENVQCNDFFKLGRIYTYMDNICKLADSIFCTFYKEERIK